jgi:hypothetical protein
MRKREKSAGAIARQRDPVELKGNAASTHPDESFELERCQVIVQDTEY